MAQGVFGIDVRLHLAASQRRAACSVLGLYSLTWNKENLAVRRNSAGQVESAGEGCRRWRSRIETSPKVRESKIRWGRSKLGWLNKLKKSTRNCKRWPSRPISISFSAEISELARPGPMNAFRPALPKATPGEAKAQALNQVCVVRTRSAARPPF